MSGNFDPNTHIKTITLVGVGGTGASTARIIARILYDMQRARQHAPSLVLIDPDRVEDKNIGRQALFAPADIGQFKAECVARRLNAALGLDIGWIAEPLDPERHADRFGSNLVISCVDNHVVSQSGCSSRLRGVWRYLKVAARFVSKWLHPPHLSLKAVATKYQGAFHVSLHI
jgi:hypothetical protein